MEFTKRSVKAAFDRAIKAGAAARKDAMAAWFWARSHGLNGGWLKDAERKINDVFGIPPIAYGNVIERLGFGSLDDGERRLEKVGVFEAMRAARVLDNKSFSALASRVDKMSKRKFAEEVDKANRRTSQGAKQMNKKSRAVAKQGTTDAECRRLREENAALKAELDEAKKENKKLWRLLDMVGGKSKKKEAS